MQRKRFISTILLALAICAMQSDRGNAEEARAKYEPTWESLNARPCPEWFTDAKFGIFIHWGVYAVPSFCDTSTYSEWYWKWITDNAHNGLERKFHEKNYGKDFPYKGFAPMFKAEMFEPDEWAELFKRSGARYVVLTSKHHDGYCLWPAPDSETWNSVETGPRRDLCGDLTEAVRAKGLKMGFYYSLYEWYHPLYQKDVNQYVAEHMLPQIKNLVERYKPAVIFADGEWDHPWETWRSTEFLAWLFNEGPNPGEVVVNDRWGKEMRSYCGDYWTTEYGHGGAEAGKTPHPWEENRGIGHSFGYNRAEGIDIYATRTGCIRMLIDLVSKGGNLLLDVGPTADGRIPVIMQDRLVAIGEWLETNGEAIYGTTRSPFPEPPAWGRATTKGSTLYLHVYDWPENGKLQAPGLLNTVKSARLLGDEARGFLPVSRADSGGIQIDLAGRFPREHATVLALELVGAPRVAAPAEEPEKAAASEK